MEKSFGLYIHIPFCVKKCAYCDFPSYPGMEDYFEKYMGALLKEAEKYRGTKADTVFIGGGTPTALPVKLMEKLLSEINRIFDILPGAEFSSEANPGTVTTEKLSVMSSFGVNRISVGVQSFNDEELKKLGRIHDSKTAMQTVENAKRYFERVNVDIMTAIPGQTRKSLLNSLSKAVETGAEHISCYSLIIEEGTPFYDLYSKGELELCSEDEDREMFGLLCEYLKKRGFERYEISNFAKPGNRCRHNLKYWNTENYIGIGAAAHSCVDRKRFSNTPDVKEYIKNPGIPEDVTLLSRDDRMSEYVIMALRTADGVDFDEFSKRFGQNFDDVYSSQMRKFETTDFLKKTEKGFALTEKGLDVSNSIMCEFLID